MKILERQYSQFCMKGLIFYLAFPSKLNKKVERRAVCKKFHKGTFVSYFLVDFRDCDILDMHLKRINRRPAYYGTTYCFWTLSRAHLPYASSRQQRTATLKSLMASFTSPHLA